MDVSLTPRLSGPARTEKIATLAKEIMQANGMADIWFTPHAPAWGDAQIAIRDEAFAEAQAQIEAEHGVPTWQPQTPVDDNDVDWSAEPETDCASHYANVITHWHYATVLQSLPTDQPHVARKLMLV